MSITVHVKTTTIWKSCLSVRSTVKDVAHHFCKCVFEIWGFTVGLLLMKQLKKQTKTHLENGEMVQQLRLKASSWVPWLPS